MREDVSKYVLREISRFLIIILLIYYHQIFTEEKTESEKGCHSHGENTIRLLYFYTINILIIPLSYECLSYL